MFWMKSKDQDAVDSRNMARRRAATDEAAAAATRNGIQQDQMNDLSAGAVIALGFKRRNQEIARLRNEVENQMHMINTLIHEKNALAQQLREVSDEYWDARAVAAASRRATDNLIFYYSTLTTESFETISARLNVRKNEQYHSIIDDLLQQGRFSDDPRINPKFLHLRDWYSPKGE